MIVELPAKRWSWPRNTWKRGVFLRAPTAPKSALGSSLAPKEETVPPTANLTPLRPDPEPAAIRRPRSLQFHTTTSRGRAVVARHDDRGKSGAIPAQSRCVSG